MLMNLAGGCASSTTRMDSVAPEATSCENTIAVWENHIREYGGGALLAPVYVNDGGICSDSDDDYSARLDIDFAYSLVLSEEDSVIDWNTPVRLCDNELKCLLVHHDDPGSYRVSVQAGDEYCLRWFVKADESYAEIDALCEFSYDGDLYQQEPLVFEDVLVIDGEVRLLPPSWLRPAASD